MNFLFIIGIGVLVLAICKFFKKEPTPNERARATEFKSHIDTINASKSDKDQKFQTALVDSWMVIKTEREYDELCRAVNKKAPYAVVFLQARWKKHKALNTPQREFPHHIHS